MGLLLSLNKYLESLQGSFQICVTGDSKIMSYPFESNSLDSQVSSREVSKDGQEGLVRDAMQLFPSRPRKRDPCEVACKVPVHQHLAEISGEQCLGQGEDTGKRRTKMF